MGGKLLCWISAVERTRQCACLRDLYMDGCVSRIKHGTAAMLVFAAGVQWACTLPEGLAVVSGMKVSVVVPAFPQCWAQADAWELSWVSATASGGPAAAVPGQTVELVLPRGSEAAVFCRAAFGASRTLPYGAVWPQGLTADGALDLSAAGGYAASLAAVFYNAGLWHCGFDLEHLAEEAEARLDDPWDLDPAGLAVIVAGRRFRVDHLKAEDRVAVTVTGLPAALMGLPMMLVPDSPWGRPAMLDASGATIVELPARRVRRWLGGGYELCVLVSSMDGPAWTLSAPDGGQRGMRMTNELPEPSLLVTDASPP